MMTKARKTLGLWENPGPDEGWSWVVLGCTWFMGLLTFGITTIGGSGILYTEFLHTFDLTREEAIWSFSVLNISQSISGLLSGILTDTFNARGILIFASCLCSFGLMLCFWANDILWIAFSFGVPFGFGNGLIHTVLPVLITKYFIMYQVTAMGIYLSSTSLAGFILPIVLSQVFEEYELRGSMLLIGGFMLNMVVGSLLLRPRNSSAFNVLNIAQESELFSKSERNGAALKSPQEGATRKNIILSLTKYKVVLSDPMFYVVSIHAVVCVNVIITIALTLTDFVMDAEIPKESGITLLSVFAAGDLIGRLFSGFISDRRYLKRRNVAAISMIVMGVCLYLVGVSRKLIVIGVIVTIMGISEGSANILITVLYREYMGAAKMTTAISLRLFIIGVLSISRPFFIGLFRDSLGSYVYFYYLLGGAAIASGCLWLLEPLITCRFTAEKNGDCLEVELED